MIIYDEFKNQENLNSFIKFIAEEVKYTYPMGDFSTVIPELSMNLCIDIGCNIGAFSAHASPFFKKIIAIEPGYITSLTAKQLVNIISGIENVQILQHAVSNVDGKVVKLKSTSVDNEFNSSNCSIVINENVDIYELVTTITLDTILELAESSFIDYLKIDCEGSEYDILLHRNLSNIGIIAGEYHIIKEKEYQEKELINHLNQFFNIEFLNQTFIGINKKYNKLPQDLFLITK